MVGSRSSFAGKSLQIVIVGMAGLLLASCAIKRSGYDVPEIPLPTQYRNSPNDDSATPSVGDSATKETVADSAGGAKLDEWWRSFGSTELAALIDRGIANNPDIRIATLKIAQAKERAIQARADQLPTVTAPIGESIQAPGGQVGLVPVGQQDTSTSQKLYQASIRGNWRIDLWGEQSALAQSAGLSLWLAAFDRDNVQRNVVANLASAYVDYLSLNDRLLIAQETDEVLSGVLTTIERRVKVGDATIIELEQQKAAVYGVRATIPTLEQQREDAIASIAFLVGSVPGALNLSSDGLDSLLLPSAVPSLPSSLILRRPDIRMMEAKLLAADADVDVARARLLPPLDLSAQMGYSSLAMSQLFQPLSFFWNALANLSVSVFNGGKLESQKEQAKAVHEEMVETYAKTIYQAVREVESALATIRLTSKRFDAQQDATFAAQRAWDGSNEAYVAGGLDHLTLLDASRTYLQYLNTYQQIKAERYRGFITLSQALGGSVDFGQPIPGKGVRPSPIREKLVRPVRLPVEKEMVSADGVEWLPGQSVKDGDDWRVERFWQVQLPGMYHRVTIGPTWRDLRTRYPRLMEGRIVRPRLSGRIQDSVDGQVSWYRLYVAKFSSPEAAEIFCSALKESYQRCRVVSSTSDETVIASVASKKDEEQTQNLTQSRSPGNDKNMGNDESLVETDSRENASKSKELDQKVRTGTTKNGKASELSDATPRMELAKDKFGYTVQLGAFSNLENAAISYAFWRDRDYDVYVSEFKDAESRTWYAVRTGVFTQRRDATLVAASLRRKEGAPAVMVPITLNKMGKPYAISASDLKLPSSVSVSQVIPEPPEAPEVTIPVEVSTGTIRSSPATKEGGLYSVQLGAFSAMENATVSLSFWENKGYKLFISEVKDSAGRTWYAVRSGRYFKRSDASASALSFGRSEGAPAVVVKMAIDIPGVSQAAEIEQLLSSGSQVEIMHLPVEAKKTGATKLDVANKQTSDLKGVFKAGRVYAIQLGAFSNVENAAKSLAEWQGRGYEVYVCETQDAQKRLRFAVRSGVFTQRQKATLLIRTLRDKENVHAVLVPAVLDSSGHLAVFDVSMLNQTPGESN